MAEYTTKYQDICASTPYKDEVAKYMTSTAIGKVPAGGKYSDATITPLVEGFMNDSSGEAVQQLRANAVKLASLRTNDTAEQDKLSDQLTGFDRSLKGSPLLCELEVPGGEQKNAVSMWNKIGWHLGKGGFCTHCWNCVKQLINLFESGGNGDDAEEMIISLQVDFAAMDNTAVSSIKVRDLTGDGRTYQTVKKSENYVRVLLAGTQLEELFSKLKNVKLYIFAANVKFAATDQATLKSTLKYVVRNDNTYSVV